MFLNHQPGGDRKVREGWARKAGCTGTTKGLWTVKREG